MYLNCVNKNLFAMGGVCVKKKEEMFLRKTTAYNHKNHKMNLRIHQQNNLQNHPLFTGLSQTELAY